MLLDNIKQFQDNSKEEKIRSEKYNKELKR